MANYKPDIADKLIKLRDNLLSQLPPFIKVFYKEYLSKIKANEIRSHIANLKDIKTFMEYLSTKVFDKPIKAISLSDMQLITTDNIDNFFTYLSNYDYTFTTKKGKVITRHRNNSDISKNRKLVSLKKLFNYLLITNNIQKNIIEDYSISATRVSKINNKLNSIDIEDIRNVINTKDNRFRNRDLTIFYLFAYTGIRVSELVSLDLKDIDTNRNIITVYRKNNKIQQIPYPATITDTIDNYLDYRRSLTPKIHNDFKKALFISQQMKRLTTESARNILKKYCQQLGIYNVTCHTLRRTFLSTLYNTTGDIRLTAKIGGHSVATASKYYADVDDERYRDTIRKFSYN